MMMAVMPWPRLPSGAAPDAAPDKPDGSAPGRRRPDHLAVGLGGGPHHDRLTLLHLVSIGDDLRQAALIELELAADVLPCRAGLAQLGGDLLAVDGAGPFDRLQHHEIGVDAADRPKIVEDLDVGLRED